MGRGVLIAASLLALAEASAMGATLRSRRLELTVQVARAGVRMRLVDRRTGQVYADGPYRYAVQVGREEEARVGLEGARVERGRRGVKVAGRLAGLPVRVEHVWLPAEGGPGWFEERLMLTNEGVEPLAFAELSFGLRGRMDGLEGFRLVAIPYRRQCDGKLHDYSMDDLRQGRFSNSDWRNDAAVEEQAVCDEGKLRSEGWSLTDGRQGLLIIKHNRSDIEYSVAQPDGKELQFGGLGLAVNREPRAATVLAPGKSFRCGETCYRPHDGGWPEAYGLFREAMSHRGHGLTPDYDPPVNWNELFDVGWYHSDRAALLQHYTREALLDEAAKAKETGCGLLYLDPGWEVCEGTTLWDEERLGTVQSLADELREEFGLGLGYRTIGRVYRDEFPNEWYTRRKGQTGPYERPIVASGPRAEQAPVRDERGCRNLALLPGAKASASSVIPGYAELHTIAHLCDGWYNNPASWISAGEPSWVEVDLGGVFTVDTVALGSEHTAHYRDRAITALTVEATTEAGEEAEWRRVVTYEGEPVRETRVFRFEAAAARRLRVSVLGTERGDEARIDELEVYEAQPGTEGGEPRRAAEPAAGQGPRLGFWEVCTQNRAWQEEKLKRILAITRQGVSFMMFDEFDWRGPCYDPSHGHPVPSTPRGHVEAIYGLIEAVERECPGVLVEAHDPVWPWAMRYVPTYFRQGLEGPRYDENWGFEFMWNPIEDLRSGRALCLYYYNLAYDIPLYDHITMEGDNDECLAFWWYASTVRHLGIGGKKGLNSPRENERRYAAYREAMAKYLALKRWFVRGTFVGLDELAHLHTLPGKAGGVLLVFNPERQRVRREVVVPWRALGVKARRGRGLAVAGAAEAEASEDGLLLRFQMRPESPALAAIGEAAVDVGE